MKTEMFNAINLVVFSLRSFLDQHWFESRQVPYDYEKNEQFLHSVNRPAISTGLNRFSDTAVRDSERLKATLKLLFKASM